MAPTEHCKAHAASANIEESWCDESLLSTISGDGEEEVAPETPTIVKATLKGAGSRSLFLDMIRSVSGGWCISKLKAFLSLGFEIPVEYVTLMRDDGDVKISATNDIIESDADLAAFIEAAKGSTIFILLKNLTDPFSKLVDKGNGLEHSVDAEIYLMDISKIFVNNKPSLSRICEAAAKDMGIDTSKQLLTLSLAKWTNDMKIGNDQDLEQALAKVQGGRYKMTAQTLPRRDVGSFPGSQSRR